MKTRHLLMALTIAVALYVSGCTPVPPYYGSSHYGSYSNYDPYEGGYGYGGNTYYYNQHRTTYVNPAYPHQPPHYVKPHSNYPPAEQRHDSRAPSYSPPPQRSDRADSPPPRQERSERRKSNSDSPPPPGDRGRPNRGASD
jgi:hypothetical protein